MDSTAVEFASEPPRDIVALGASAVRPASEVPWHGARRIPGLRRVAGNDNAPLARTGS